MPLDHHIDEIDKRILYYLADDARNTTAPMIAEEVDVTPATIRNRIHQLEERGIIRGYDATIDYERASGLTTIQFTCTAPVPDRRRLAQEAGNISGVITVRELLAGRENLLITVATTDTDDVSRIGRELAELGLTIDQEDTIHTEYNHPYQPFGPGRNGRRISVADFRSLSGGSEVLEFTVSESSAIAGVTIQEASDRGLLEDVLVVNIERGETMLTPKGETTIQQGDIITLFSQTPLSEGTVEAFEVQEPGGR